MDPFVAIDTSTSPGSVAVGRGDDIQAEVVAGVRARHSEALLPALDSALRSAGTDRSGVAGVVVGGGPGSFTGIRIAAATAKGLVRALEVPLFAYSGLLALAASVGGAERPVCALFDARRGEVYAGCWRFPGFAAVESVLPPTARPLDAVIEEVDQHAPIYAGDGALAYAERLERAAGTVAPAHLAVPRASALLWLADLVPAAGRIDSPGAWEPSYLRPSGASRGVPG